MRLNKNVVKLCLIKWRGNCERKIQIKKIMVFIKPKEQDFEEKFFNRIIL